MPSLPLRNRPSSSFSPPAARVLPLASPCASVPLRARSFRLPSSFTPVSRLGRLRHVSPLRHFSSSSSSSSSSSFLRFHLRRNSVRLPTVAALISRASAADPRRNLPLYPYPAGIGFRCIRNRSSSLSTARDMAEATDRLQSRPEGTERLADGMEKPLLDHRSYRVIRLPNQLQALLIHDPDTDNASAAMDVNVGSMSDPEDMQGMAHAVEHLLFLGTDKFPQENEYNQYLNKYGGYSNAFTAPTSTNYYFELVASSTAKTNRSSSADSGESGLAPAPKPTPADSPLYGALDRFSRFFVKPLFLEDVLDRELRAVDSENKKNLQNDQWRLMQLAKSLSSKNHPYHLFSTGNYKLLHDDPIARGVKIRDEFINFYEKHYSANRMKLCVLGKEDLDTLQAWVEEFFSPVLNQNLPQLRWDGIPAQTADELGIQIFVKPVMDMRLVDIVFPYPDEDDFYESHPSRYISHLLGHEGPGSVMAYLKDKGWATELSAGPHSVCPGTAFFSVSIRVTTEGLKNYEDIISTVFRYIALMKEQPPQEWIVWESSQLAENEFKFRQQIPASRTTSSLSGTMQKPLPRDWLLSGQFLTRKFDPEGITRGLEALRPDNFRFVLVSKEYPGDWNMKEQWYGTEYRCERIPPAFMRSVEAAAASTEAQRPAELHLPHRNEFIPTRLDVEKKDVREPALAPRLIRNDRGLRLWWKKDDQFWVPKANLFVALRSPVLSTSAFATVLSHLYKDLVDDALDTYAYDAALAGLDYGILRSAEALEINVSGYNDKMHVLLDKVLLTMRDLEFTDERFEIIKERLGRGFRNKEFSEPFRQVNNYTRWITRERHYQSSELLDELQPITANDVRDFFPRALRQMHIEVLVHGNVYKEEALRITDRIQSVLNPLAFPEKQWHSDRSIELPPGSDYLLQHTLANPDNVNHCIEYVVHVGDAQDRSLRAKHLLLSHLLEEPVFNVLRTQEQLGYIVMASALVYTNRLMHRILVQSEKDCPYLEQRIDAFLLAYEGQLRSMSDADFEAQKVGVINKRLERLKNLNQESGRFWYHIASEMFDFELVHRDVEHFEPLTKDDMLEFFATFFRPGSPTRAKHSIHLIAQPPPEQIDSTVTLAEQRDNLSSTLGGVFTQLGIDVDPAALSAHLAKADIAVTDVLALTTALVEYLKQTAGVAAEQLEQATKLLPQLLPMMAIRARPEEPAPKQANGHKKGAVVIEDVRAFRSSFPLARAPKPAKDISEFEELESKL